MFLDKATRSPQRISNPLNSTARRLSGSLGINGYLTDTGSFKSLLVHTLRDYFDQQFLTAGLAGHSGFATTCQTTHLKKCQNMLTNAILPFKYHPTVRASLFSIHLHSRPNSSSSIQIQPNKALQPTPSRFAGWGCSVPLLAAHRGVGLIARSGWLSLTFGFEKYEIPTHVTDHWTLLPDGFKIARYKSFSIRFGPRSRHKHVGLQSRIKRQRCVARDPQGTRWQHSERRCCLTRLFYRQRIHTGCYYR